MKKKLNCILLIDDDELTNYINEITVNETDCTENLVTAESGKEALHYLQTKVNQGHPSPDLILLDINMPAMDGWDFLAEYKKLEDSFINKIIVVMLTTSLNPEDEEKANLFDEVKDYKNKPLTVELLDEIVSKHFHWTL